VDGMCWYSRSHSLSCVSPHDPPCREGQFASHPLAAKGNSRHPTYHGKHTPHNPPWRPWRRMSGDPLGATMRHPDLTLPSRPRGSV
jgi:hypothetical protein